MIHEYHAKVLRWIDGDTVDMEVDLGFHMKSTQRFRLLGCDTPERGMPGWAEATEFSLRKCPVGSVVSIETEKSDAFGRFLANVTLANGQSLSEALKASGHATEYVR